MVRRKASENNATGTIILWGTGGVSKTKIGPINEVNGPWESYNPPGYRSSLIINHSVNPDIYFFITGDPQPFAFIGIPNTSTYALNRFFYVGEKNGILYISPYDPTLTIPLPDISKAGKLGDGILLLAGADGMGVQIDPNIPNEFKFFTDIEEWKLIKEPFREPYPENSYYLYPYFGRYVPVSGTLFNRRNMAGSQLFTESGRSYLSGTLSTGLITCEFFGGISYSQHIGLGNFITTIEYGYIGYTLASYSAAGHLYYPRFIKKKNNTCPSPENTPLNSSNFNFAGARHIAYKNQPIDDSVNEFYGSGFEYNSSGEGSIQFRWNFWNEDHGGDRYPVHQAGTTLPALNKYDQFRNFPVYPRQQNYNISMAWKEGIPNSEGGGIWSPGQGNFLGGGSLDNTTTFYVSTDHLSFTRSDQILTLKFFCVRDCSINIRSLGSTLISNYAEPPVRFFDNSLFLLPSSITLKAGEFRDVQVRVGPLLQNPSPTMISNRYHSNFVLEVGSLDSASGQVRYLEITYLPKYKVYSVEATKAITNGLKSSERRIWGDDINYVLPGTRIYFKAIGQFTGFASISEIINNPNEEGISFSKSFLSFSEENNYEDYIEVGSIFHGQEILYTTITLEISIIDDFFPITCSPSSEKLIKKYSFQSFNGESSEPTISEEVEMPSSPVSFNFNNSFIWFEDSLTKTVPFSIRPMGKEEEKLFFYIEDNDDLVDVIFESDSKIGANTVGEITFIKRDAEDNRDFFIKGSMFIKEERDEDGNLISPEYHFPVYITNFYPIHNNFKPINMSFTPR